MIFKRFCCQHMNVFLFSFNWNMYVVKRIFNLYFFFTFSTFNQLLNESDSSCLINPKVPLQAVCYGSFTAQICWSTTKEMDRSKEKKLILFNIFLNMYIMGMKVNCKFIHQIINKNTSREALSLSKMSFSLSKFKFQWKVNLAMIKFERS